jgi:CRP-like cAMP-binding protein
MRPTEKQILQLRNSMEKIYPLTNDCWFDIEHLIYIKQLNKNDYFSKEGQITKDLGFVFEGALRIYFQNEKGDEWNKHFLQKNDFVGASIIPEKKSIVNIQALTKTTLLCVPYNDFEEILKKYNGKETFIQKLVFSLLEQKQEREIRLRSSEAMDNYQAFRQIFPDLENIIQHYHIASYLGITPTQLSRIRKKLNSHQHM